MKKTIVTLLVSLILVVSPLAAQVPSTPVAGIVSGIELCPQFICGVAVFAGSFHGKVGLFPNATGIVATAVKHGELPTQPGDMTPIYAGGVWELNTPLRRLSGVVNGGCIEANGANNTFDNTFDVTISLTIRSGGYGDLTFSGTLNHNPTIPTFGGTLVNGAVFGPC
jgi:hypothetical protein